MFSFGFTKDDLKRAIWTFAQAAIAYGLAAAADGGFTVKALVVGAIAAGLSALKNFVLADGSTAK